MVFEKSTKEGASPVCENILSLISILSIMGHEESCENLGGPLPKAKYI